MAFRKDKKFNSDFTKITISLASPESILERSHGEVFPMWGPRTNGGAEKARLHIDAERDKEIITNKKNT